MMITKDDIVGVCDYLKNTPEQPLRKMMIAADFSEVQFRLLLKLAKGSAEAEFISAFELENFGKLKLKPDEIQIREVFWPLAKKKLGQIGLLNINIKKAA